MCNYFFIIFIIITCVLHRYINIIILILEYSYSFNKVLSKFFLYIIEKNIQKYYKEKEREREIAEVIFLRLQLKIMYRFVLTYAFNR